MVQICFGVGEQPRSCLGFFGADVSVVVEEVNGRVDDGFVERCDGDALVAGSEGVDGVDVTVAGEAEGGGVGLACEVSGGLFADLAEGEAGVAGGEHVGGVDLGVAGGAEEGGVRRAVEGGGGGFAGVTELGRHGGLQDSV